MIGPPGCRCRLPSGGFLRPVLVERRHCIPAGSCKTMRSFARTVSTSAAGSMRIVARGLRRGSVTVSKFSGGSMVTRWRSATTTSRRAVGPVGSPRSYTTSPSTAIRTSVPAGTASARTAAVSRLGFRTFRRSVVGDRAELVGPGDGDRQSGFRVTVPVAVAGGPAGLGVRHHRPYGRQRENTDGTGDRDGALVGRSPRSSRLRS